MTNQVIPLRVRVYMGAIAMKGYFPFPKTPALLWVIHIA